MKNLKGEKAGGKERLADKYIRKLKGVDLFDDKYFKIMLSWRNEILNK